MYCFYHPERSAVTHCAICGKPLCSECIIVKENLSYCTDCVGKSVLPSWTRKMIFPALVCGIITGCLSVLAVAGPLNCAFCLSTVIGGAGAVLIYRYTNNIKGKVDLKKVTLIGLMTGFIASAAMWLCAFVSAGSFGSQLRDIVTQNYQQAITETGGAGVVVVLVFLIMIGVAGIPFALFAVLGGIICNGIVGRAK
ncbi:MAG: hypothetical protein HXS54_02705 [Theionarchaea archaeon]|nr:hypothetical protein [Theionarchaea archaeon]